MTISALVCVLQLPEPSGGDLASDLHLCLPPREVPRPPRQEQDWVLFLTFSPLPLPRLLIDIWLSPPSFPGVFWKAARVGERLSPYVSLCCVAMGLTLLFLT